MKQQQNNILTSYNITTEFVSKSLNYINFILKKDLNCFKNIKDIYPFIQYDENQVFENFPKVAFSKNYIDNLYETSIPTNSKKDFGQFYTNNNEIIDKMINSVELLNGKILEPACGSGLFLVQIIKKIIKELQIKEYDSAYILDYIIENIYGNDVDSNVLKICEINILLTLLPLIIETLNKNPNYILKKINLYNYDFTKKNLFSKDFSLVIGNPPFVTMYGKRSRNMTEEKRKYYNTFDFVQNKKKDNKFNLSMFFIENSLNLLKENGQFSFILDITFLETAFIDMRKYIVENFYIDSLIYGLKIFKNVTSGQIVLNLKNKKAKNKNIKISTLDTNNIYFIDQLEWSNSKNKYKFLLPLKEIEKNIISKIENFKSLDYFFPNKSLRTCCALTGKTDEFIVDSNYKKHPIYPYLEGAKSLKSKFSILDYSHYIKYDYELQLKLSDLFKEELEKIGVKNKKRVTLGDEETYKAPKIFIRQSSSNIIATYTEKPMASNNSLYILTEKKYDTESKNKLKYVCGLLNSDLITFYCLIKKIIRNDKGKTPQIKISDLKTIRLNFDDKYFEKIIEIVNKLLRNPSDNFSLKSLNEIIYQIYSISSREIEYINKYLKNI